MPAVAHAHAAAQPPASRAVEKPSPAAVERRLSDAVRRNPDSFDAQYELGSFYAQRGKLLAAVPHLKRAHEIKPADYASGHDLALALLEVGQLNDAQAVVLQMLAAKDTAELHDLLGNVYERAGNFRSADEQYERAAQMDPSEEHLFDWGNNLLKLSNFDKATQVFAAAITRHPQAARLRVGLGIAQYSRGQHEDAVKAFCQAADLAPSDPRPYQFLGEMYGVVPALAGDITERLARFAKSHPRNGQAQFNYAMSLWKGQPDAPGDPRQVEKLLRRAVSVDSKLAKAFLELGILLSDQQRFAEAIPQLQSAIRVDPDLAPAHYRLGQAYQRTGQKALAAKELEIFASLQK